MQLGRSTHRIFSIIHKHYTGFHVLNIQKKKQPDQQENLQPQANLEVLGVIKKGGLKTSNITAKLSASRYWN